MKIEKIEIDKLELNVHDWTEMRQGALDLLKNAMAQAVVYKGQIRTAEAEMEKFPEPEKPKESAEKVPETKK